MKIPEFSTLTVPLDGSPLSERVLPLSVAMATALESRIELISIPHFGASYAATIPDVEIQLAQAKLQDSVADLIEPARERTRAYLLEHAEQLREKGREVAVRVGTNRPARTIVRMSNEAEDSLILMSTHSRGGVGRWLFGSVAERVLHLTSQPLMLLPGAAESAPDRLPRKILVALDGSAAAEAVLGPVVSLARTFGASLTLAHVEPDFGEMIRSGAKQMLEIEGRYQDWLSSYLAGVQERIEEWGVKSQGSPLGGGHAVETLLAETARTDHDLIALTTHGGGGPGKWPVGSVTNRLIRGAITPVLVVPST